MNKKNLLRVASAIERAPDKAFNMSDYGDGGGSPRCIAGYAMHLAGAIAAATGSNRDVESVAGKFLGLTNDERKVLFCGLVNVDLLRKVSRFDAVALLRNAAERGEIDWAAVSQPEIADALAKELS